MDNIRAYKIIEARKTSSVNGFTEIKLALESGMRFKLFWIGPIKVLNEQIQNTCRRNIITKFYP